ncbi:hypothetical protein [Shewanella sp. NIFS-20-20]|uniref:hypothetical protein n=1 Tax=Shewanella sp. NIFS-20-20 TaxID=2853806 RepID=UPI001C475BD6|nr:hypothetical protein [Shewanella sp. NIFS-20-20]MBV7314478.1 hypothetical protein [Shewanella sp. NIFS-20-20]
MTHQDICFPYKPKIWLGLVIMPIGIFLSYLLALSAYQRDRGLILFDLIHLSPAQASIFLWCLGVISLLFALLGGVIFMASLARKRVLVLSAQGLQSPKSGISRKIITLDWQQIEAISSQTVGSQVFFHLHHGDGKLTLVSSLFANQAAFEHAITLVLERLELLTLEEAI